MPRDRYQDQHDPQTKYKLRGSLITKMARQLNASGQGAHGGPHGATQQGTTHNALPPGGRIFGQAVIQQVDPDSEESSCDESSSQLLPPCRPKHLYLARFRAYDFDLRQWVEYDEDVSLDASGLFEPDETQASAEPAGGSDLGAIPRLIQGDTLPAYWDGQRVMLIPLTGIPQEPPSQDFYGQTEQYPPGYGAGMLATAAVQQLVRADSQVDEGSSQSSPSSPSSSPAVPQSDGETWRTVTYVHWFLPPLPSAIEYELQLDTLDLVDTRAGQGVTRARDGDRFRVVLTNYSRYWSVALRHYRLRLTQIGRDSVENHYVQLDGPVPEAPVLGQNRTGTHVQGRYADAPAWRLDSDADDRQMVVRFDDPHDNALLRVELFAELSSEAAPGGCEIGSEDFARPDSSDLGGNWLQLVGTMQVDNQELLVTTAGARARYRPSQRDNEFRILGSGEIWLGDAGDQAQLHAPMWGDDASLYAEVTAAAYPDCGTLQLYDNRTGTPTAIGEPTPIEAEPGRWHNLEICYRVHDTDPSQSYLAARWGGQDARWRAQVIDVTGETPDARGITLGLGTGNVTSQVRFDQLVVEESKGPAAADAGCQDCVRICTFLQDRFARPGPRNVAADVGCDYEVISGTWVAQQHATSIYEGTLIATVAGVIKCAVPVPLPPYVRVYVETVSPYVLALANFPTIEGMKYRVRVDYDGAGNYFVCELSLLEYIAIYNSAGNVLDKHEATKDVLVVDPNTFAISHYGRFAGPMRICLGPDGLHFSVSSVHVSTAIPSSGGQHPSSLFTPVATSGGSFVGLEVDRANNGFANLQLEQSYDPASKVCEPCPLTECECNLCPDDNAPAGFSVDLTGNSWNPSLSVCSNFDQVVLAYDCYYPAPASTSRDYMPAYIPQWSKFGLTAPDSYCVWGRRIFIPGPSLRYYDVLVMVTSRAGSLAIECMLLADNSGLFSAYGSSALSGNCADISTTIGLSNVVPVAGFGATCIDGAGSLSMHIDALTAAEAYP